MLERPRWGRYFKSRAPERPCNDSKLFRTVNGRNGAGQAAFEICIHRSVCLGSFHLGLNMKEYETLSGVSGRIRFLRFETDEFQVWHRIIVLTSQNYRRASRVLIIPESITQGP